MYKWLLDIYENGSLLDSFTQFPDYGSDEGRIIAEYNLSDHPFYYFTSNLLNSIYQESEALHKAKELLVIFNGICYLLNLTITNFIPGSIRSNSYYEQTSAIFFGDKYPSTIDILMKGRHEHDNYHKVLRLMGRSHKNIQWMDLYKIYEILKKELGEQKLAQITSKKNWNKFTGTANFSIEAGDEARHAIPNKDIKDTMPIDEARKLIKTACQNWVEEAFNIKINNKLYFPEYISLDFDNI